MEKLDSVSKVLRQKGSEVISIRSDDSVYSAVALMAEKKIGALLVMDNDRLMGILSERDYARKVVLKGRSSHETQIREIMTDKPITVSPDCSVEDAMRVMTLNRVRHLPVVERDGQVAGVLSIGDLVKWMLISQEETIKKMENYISGARAAKAG